MNERPPTVFERRLPADKETICKAVDRLLVLEDVSRRPSVCPVCKAIIGEQAESSQGKEPKMLKESLKLIVMVFLWCLASLAVALVCVGLAQFILPRVGVGDGTTQFISHLIGFSGFFGTIGVFLKRHKAG